MASHAHVSAVFYAMIFGGLWIVAVSRRGEPIKALEGAMIVFAVVWVATILVVRLLNPKFRDAISSRPQTSSTGRLTPVLIAALSLAPGVVAVFLIPGRQSPLLFGVIAFLVLSRLHRLYQRVHAEEPEAV